MRFLLGFLLSVTVCYSQELRTLSPTIGPESISEDAQKRFYRFQELVNSAAVKEELSPRDSAILAQGGDETLEDPWQTQSDACSWYCGGGPSKITCSSFLQPQGKNTYVAGNTHDFTIKTAWVEGKTGSGVGEYIEFTFGNKSPRVTSAIVWNGYQKNMSTWRENPRVKALRLYINGKASYDLALADTAGPQVFKLGTLGHRPDGKDLLLRFQIKAIYPGSRYSDAAISEINFDGLDVHCFASGSMVQLDLRRQKPIEEIAVGDTVLAYDAITGGTFPDQVTEIGSWVHSDLARLGFAGTSLTCTRGHPIFTLSKGWCSLTSNLSQTLAIGDTVLLFDGARMHPTCLLTIDPIPDSRPTYSILRLETGSAFFVNGVVVGLELHSRQHSRVAVVP